MTPAAHLGFWRAGETSKGPQRSQGLPIWKEQSSLKPAANLQVQLIFTPSDGGLCLCGASSRFALAWTLI
jgi:hypothetical protein